MNQVQKFLLKAFSRIPTTLATTASQLVATGQWTQLQELSLQHPASYKNAEAYRLDALVTELFRKCRLPADKERLAREARTVFWASEAQCKVTNIRLSRFQSNTMNLRDSSDLRVSDFINRWRKEVKRVLGRVSYVLEPMFSQGSTLSDSGMQTTIPDKMTSEPTCYLSGLPFYTEAFSRTPQGERYPEPVIVRSNRFFTVPKDSFKDRGCCMEASAMVSLQLALGAAMKKRYQKSYGYSLKSRPLRHQRLARLASAGRLDLATIDLSNASDTISYGVVQLVVPDDWLFVLNSLRAPTTFVEGKVVRLEKFSSMGNGFTFELETILYQTLCDTVIGERKASSFGDDMIVPGSSSADVIAALRFFGFTPNNKKTFCEGPFRESCGGDYFEGKPVRAHYLKELPDEPQKWIALANGLRRADPTLKYYAPAWYYCVDQLPVNIRKCRGPAWLGDVVLHDPSAEPTFRTYKTRIGGLQTTNSPTWFFRIYRAIPKSYDLGQHFSYRVATAAAALGVPADVVPRNSISGYKLDWVAAFGRSDFFGWLEN